MSETAVETPPTHDHYATLEQQAAAVKIALAIFLSSEALLFTGIFALIVAYQSDWPNAFRIGIEHNTKILGSINTGVLLISSTLVALAVDAQREGRRMLAGSLTLATALLGIVFLAIKMTEYAKHFSDGIYPGGRGHFFIEHPEHGLPTFWSLYFLATGLHALHVTIGTGILTYRGIMVFKGSLTHSLEATALYWHFVDIIWIFLWPIFYLA